jgi:hypothetical protein
MPNTGLDVDRAITGRAPAGAATLDVIKNPNCTDIIPAAVHLACRSNAETIQQGASLGWAVGGGKVVDLRRLFRIVTKSQALRRLQHWKRLSEKSEETVPSAASRLQRKSLIASQGRVEYPSGWRKGRAQNLTSGSCRVEGYVHPHALSATFIDQLVE